MSGFIIIKDRVKYETQQYGSRCHVPITKITYIKSTSQVLSCPRLVRKCLAVVHSSLSPKELDNRVTAVCDTFAGMWGLEADNPETAGLIEKTRAHPQQFVLKPQLEGALITEC